MRGDHETIRKRVPQDWYMTTVGEQSHGKCDGRSYFLPRSLLHDECSGDVAPDGCSGLAVVSRFPFIEVKRFFAV